MISFEEFDRRYNGLLKEHKCRENDSRAVDSIVYYKCFQTDHKPTSIKNLQDIAGGGYRRVSIAYELLNGEFESIPLERDKPEWFVQLEQALFESVQKKLNIFWKQVDGEIQSLAQSRSRIAEGKAEQSKLLGEQYLNAIDALEEQLLVKTSECDKLQEQIDGLLSYKENTSALESRCEVYQERINELQRDLNGTKDKTHEYDLLSIKFEFLQQKYDDVIKHSKSLQLAFDSLSSRLSNEPNGHLEAVELANSMCGELDNIDSE